jgi:hypothetical protein
MHRSKSHFEDTIPEATCRRGQERRDRRENKEETALHARMSNACARALFCALTHGAGLDVKFFFVKWTL